MAPRKPPPEPEAPPGAARRTVDRVTTTRETLPDTDARDAPIEVWLGDLAGDSTLAYVRVWKRAGARWSWLGKRNDILPPFDFDPDALFQLYGDGEYRFVPYDTTGRMRGGRNELIQAGYAGKFRAAPDGTTSAPGDEPDAASVDLSEMIKLQRQRMILRNLREASGEGAELGGAPYPAERGDDLDRLSQLATIISALQPKPLDVAALLGALGTIMGPIITRLLQPPDPADKVFSLFEKWLDLRERIEPGDSGDWKSALVRGLGQLLENPQLRAALLGGGVAAQPAIAPQSPPPPPPPTVPSAPPGTAPSPANGHPGPATGGPPLSDEERQAQRVLATLIWPLVKRAALDGSEDRETYAALMDQQLPGFLEQWTAADPNLAIQILGRLDPDVLTNVDLQRWLLAFHQWAREDFLQREDADDEPGSPGGGMPQL